MMGRTRPRGEGRQKGTPLKHFLRVIYYSMIRLANAIRGENRATLARLRKQGRVDIGETTAGYAIPTIRHFVHDDTRLRIGEYCSMSPWAYVYLGGRHSMVATTTYPHRILWGMDGAGEDGYPTPTGDTWIGSDVWLCPGSHVMSGLRIGNGAIIGVGSIVTRDVPDYAIVAGNPAKVLGWRHTEEQRAALLEIAWWDWPREEVRRAVPLLADPDVDAFIDYARRRFPDGPGTAPADVPAPANTWQKPIASPGPVTRPAAVTS